jgi:hypothetical protein
MQIADYYKIRRALQENAPAPDETATTSMEVDLRGALMATGLFHTIEVGHTDDADRRVIAMCEFAPDLDASEAALAVARLWTKQIAHGFWEANTLRVDKGHVELQGATRVSVGGHYFTVHLIAQAAPAPAAVRSGVLGHQVPSTGIMAANGGTGAEMGAEMGNAVA